MTSRNINQENKIEVGAPEERRPDPERKTSLEKALGAISMVMGSLGTVWYFALMLVITAEVLSRLLFNLPIRGITEIVAYSMVGAVFLQVANTLFKDRMIRAGFLLDTFKITAPKLAISMELGASIAGALIIGALAIVGYSELIEAWHTNEVVGVPGFFTFQVWPFRLFVFLGAALTTAIFLLRAFTFLRASWEVGNWRGLGFTVLTNGIAAFAIYLGIQYALDTLPSNASIGIAMIVLLLVGIFLGLHVGVVLMATGFIGLWLVKGKIVFAMTMVGIAASDYLANYFFSAIPLFVLMGLLVSAADIGKETFQVARWIMRPIPGGLGVATVAANSVFAAITGSSIASAAVFTKVAAPEMVEMGYTPRFSVGVVAGSSVLGMLIPPSILLIVYGLVAEQSIGILFISALVPGFILAGLMCVLIMGMSRFAPKSVYTNGKPLEITSADLMSPTKAIVLLAPLVGLVGLVLGGIYGGLFTPTEGGAIGSLGALILAFMRGKLTRSKFWEVIVETGQITTAVLFMIFAANVFTRMLAGSGVVQEISAGIVSMDLGFVWFMILYVALLVVLGMFLESISIMLIVVPIALPASIILGADPIWFGILTVVAVEVGLLTPPLGLTVYVVKATIQDIEVTLSDIFKGALPFVGVMLLTIAILIAAPWLGSIKF